MGEGETFETRPDRLHRYGNLVAAGLMLAMGIVGLATIDGNQAWIMFVGVALFATIGAFRLQSRLVVSPLGLQVNRGRVVAWTEVKSHRYVDTSEWWSPDWCDFPSWDLLFEVLAWPFVVVFRWVVYIPVRALVRWILYRPRDRWFLDARLDLLDGAGKVLASIRGEERYVDVDEALVRIDSALQAQALAPLSLGGRSAGRRP